MVISQFYSGAVQMDALRHDATICAVQKMTLLIKYVSTSSVKE
jgi:hypothetical protein